MRDTIKLTIGIEYISFAVPVTRSTILPAIVGSLYQYTNIQIIIKVCNIFKNMLILLLQVV
jgi:hypothetical protein